MVTWVAGVLIKISVYYWAIALGSAQLLDLKDYRPLVLPVGVILLALSIMIHDSVMDLFVYTGTFVNFVLIIFEAVIPLFLLVVAVIRGQGRKQNQG